MKKPIVIGSIILITVIVTGFFFYNIQEDDVETIKEFGYDPTKSESLYVEYIVESLENCQGSSHASTDAERNQFQFCSYDISDSNLTKLKAIENIKGNKICDFSEMGLSNTCKVSDYIKPNSEIIWRFDWTEIGVRNNRHYIMLAREDKDYFFVNARDFSNTPFSGSIYVIKNLNPETTSKLKSD